MERGGELLQIKGDTVRLMRFRRVLDETRRFMLLKADLTQFESPDVRQIRDRFDVVGLPTLVFIDGQGNERKDLRVYGFEDAPAFLARMRQVR